MKPSSQHVYMFSGGKDSTAMLIEAHRRKMPIDRILFADIGAEWPQMYAHIRLVERYIGRKIEVVRHPRGDFFYWFKNHTMLKGARKGERGYGWCGKLRWGTAQKRHMIKRAIPVDAIEYHGVAANEGERTKKNEGRNIRYPLVEWGMSEADNLEYCYRIGFDWGGLYEHLDRVSCWCCEMKNLRELRAMHDHFPDTWAKLEALQAQTPYPYKGKGVGHYTRLFREQLKFGGLK